MLSVLASLSALIVLQKPTIQTWSVAREGNSLEVKASQTSLKASDLRIIRLGDFDLAARRPKRGARPGQRMTATNLASVVRLGPHFARGLYVVYDTKDKVAPSSPIFVLEAGEVLPSHVPLLSQPTVALGLDFVSTFRNDAGNFDEVRFFCVAKEETYPDEFDPDVAGQAPKSYKMLKAGQSPKSFKPPEKFMGENFAFKPGSSLEPVRVLVYVRPLGEKIFKFDTKSDPANP